MTFQPSVDIKFPFQLILYGLIINFIDEYQKNIPLIYTKAARGGLQLADEILDDCAVKLQSKQR